MGRTLFKIFIVLLILIFAGGSGFFGYRAFQLDKEKLALEANIEQLNRLKAGLKAKYEQEKAAAAALQRAKLAVEAQWREAEARADGLQEKLQALLDAQKSSQAELEKKLKSSEAKVDQLNQTLSALQVKFEDLVAKHNVATREVKNGEQQIEELTAENQTLQSDLERNRRTNERYKKHNIKLSELSRELLAKIAGDSGIRTAMPIDPITKLGQVELEKMIQEYLDRIDEDTLSSQEQ